MKIYYSLKKLFSILSFIGHHPLAGKNKFASYQRFFSWQLKQSISTRARVCAFVEDSVLLIEKGMAGATGNIYCGLLDFVDMAFVLHLLRPGDLMGDIGANVGVYTVLAAKNTGANVISLEPVPSTFQHLKNNIDLNKISELATIINCGASSENGELEFTKELDAVNHVAVSVVEKNYDHTVTIKVQSLDTIFKDKVPLLLKIDVEGFEHEVIKGAANLLNSDNLKAIIIELNGSGMRYGFSDEKIHGELISFGFVPYLYDPFERKIKRLNKPGTLNTLYLRSEEWIMKRISSAKKFNILGQSI
jgi:FkbM family methyltransferase